MIIAEIGIDLDGGRVEINKARARRPRYEAPRSFAAVMNQQGRSTAPSPGKFNGLFQDIGDPFASAPQQPANATAQEPAHGTQRQPVTKSLGPVSGGQGAVTAQTFRAIRDRINAGATHDDLGLDAPIVTKARHMGADRSGKDHPHAHITADGDARNPLVRAAKRLAEHHAGKHHTRDYSHMKSMMKAAPAESPLAAAAKRLADQASREIASPWGGREHKGTLPQF